jgi:type IV secretion system protein VirD4
MEEYGIILGKHVDGWIIRLPGGTPVALHAATGSGKTADFVMPNAFTHPGSLVVLDIKGEIYEATAGHRAAMGQDVYLFEPASLTSQSHRWDPFGAVLRGQHSRFRDIARQANLIFPEQESTSGGSNNHKFWDDAGRQALAAVATILCESSDVPLTMESVTNIFTRNDGHEWLARQVADRRAAGRPFSQIAVNGISDYIGDDPKLRGDIRKTVSTRLQTWFYDPQICACTEASDFDLSDLRKKPMTIYVVVAPGDMPRLKPLLRLFFDQAVTVNTTVTPKQDHDLKYQTMFLMDEFARLGRIDSLAHAAQYVRGYGLRMVYTIQDRAQLRNIYGDEGAADIFANVGAEVVFGVADPELAKDLEQRMGDNTVSYSTRNKPRYLPWAHISKQTESESPHARPLMFDQEIMTMSLDEQLILVRGMRPQRTNRVRWFNDPDFTTRVQPPPPVPDLKINVKLDDGMTRILPPQPPGDIKHGR